MAWRIAHLQCYFSCCDGQLTASDRTRPTGPGNTGCDRQRGVPAFSLHAAAPNTFTVTTVFSYDAPEAARVTPDIITLDDKEVTRIVDTAVAPECHILIWNGQVDVGDPLPSGEYQYLMQTNRGFTQSRRLRIIRSDFTIQAV